MTVDLSTLISPLTSADFLAGSWPFTPWVDPARDDRAVRLEAVAPQLVSTEDLLDGFRGRVGLMSPTGFRASTPDGRAALPFYRQSFTCYLRNVETHVPALRDVLDALADELGMPRQNLTCEVFCSDGASGVAMHSDYDINFAIQLRGTKTWSIGRNESLSDPLTTLIPDGRPQRDARQLRWLQAPLPTKMPPDADVVEVERGGLVFLPRGWWHQTAAEGTCLQLNFVVKGPHWLSVLANGLTELLAEQPQWRRFAFGIAGNADQKERAVKDLAGLLETLSDQVRADGGQELARDIISAAAGSVP
jgi:50S ribosomal protein L16 3-hydroxylase